MRPNLELWSEISSLYLSRRCEVLAEVMREGLLGRAWLSESGDPFISVRYDPDMLHTWLHELGHHVLGHVTLPRHEQKPYSPGDYAEPWLKEHMAEYIDNREQAADDWAEQTLAELLERTPNALEALWIHED